MKVYVNVSLEALKRQTPQSFRSGGFVFKFFFSFFLAQQILSSTNNPAMINNHHNENVNNDQAYMFHFL